MKVIFLDIDGVLVTKNHLLGLMDSNQPSTDARHRHLFTPKCVACLKQIVDSTDAKIVLSSTWKVFGKEVFIELWKERNCPGEIIDFTPDFRNRGTEIDEWINGVIRFKHDIVESFVIIDDDIADLLIGQSSRIVRTSWDDGLTDKHIDDVIRILNTKVE